MQENSTTSLTSGLLQNREEWTARNNILSDNISTLINTYIKPAATRALDVGCQKGRPVDLLSQRTNLEWAGVDPAITDTLLSARGISLYNGTADKISFPDQHFDCVVLANVWEHIFPNRYVESITEMKRVLKPGGVLVGQLPNPYFPIESHSRLPFMGWLPVPLQHVYWKLTPVPWVHDFYVVTIRHLKRHALAGGLKTELIRNFNYPREVIPASIRRLSDLGRPLMRVMPWAWHFVFRKPESS